MQKRFRSTWTYCTLPFDDKQLNSSFLTRNKNNTGVWGTRYIFFTFSMSIAQHQSYLLDFEDRFSNWVELFWLGSLPFFFFSKKKGEGMTTCRRLGVSGEVQTQTKTCYVQRESVLGRTELLIVFQIRIRPQKKGPEHNDNP